MISKFVAEGCPLRGHGLEFFLSVYVPIGIFYLLVKSEEQQEDILQVPATSFHALPYFFSLIEVSLVSTVIVTEGRHPIPSRYIYQNAAFWMTIRFVYIVQSGGGGEECASNPMMILSSCYWYH